MSLTGRLYKLSEEELTQILQTRIYQFDYLKDSIDLSYFAIDYLDIISAYSGFRKKEVGKLLEGTHALRIEDGYLAYSKATDVKHIKLSILDKITTEAFVSYLDRAEQENHILGSYYSSKADNRKYIITFFDNVKRIYEEASHEDKCLLYRIG